MHLVVVIIQNVEFSCGQGVEFSYATCGPDGNKFYRAHADLKN